MTKPIITKPQPEGQGVGAPMSATGRSFCVFEWSGSGPEYLHVHHSDDEAWHVLEGSLTFRFEDGLVQAPAGTTVFVPAGVPHAYLDATGVTRYLIILTPRLQALIEELHKAPLSEHGGILQRYDSAIVG